MSLLLYLGSKPLSSVSPRKWVVLPCQTLPASCHLSSSCHPHHPISYDTYWLLSLRTGEPSAASGSSQKQYLQPHPSTWASTVDLNFVLSDNFLIAFCFSWRVCVVFFICVTSLMSPNDFLNTAVYHIWHCSIHFSHWSWDNTVEKVNWFTGSHIKTLNLPTFFLCQLCYSCSRIDNHSLSLHPSLLLPTHHTPVRVLSTHPCHTVLEAGCLVSERPLKRHWLTSHSE